MHGNNDKNYTLYEELGVDALVTLSVSIYGNYLLITILTKMDQ